MPAPKPRTCPNEPVLHSTPGVFISNCPPKAPPSLPYCKNVDSEINPRSLKIANKAKQA